MQASRLLASTNLANWEPIASFIATNSPAANMDHAFYVVRGNNLITDAQRLPDGQFSLVIAGEFGCPHVVEYSTNRVYWAPIFTNV